MRQLENTLWFGLGLFFSVGFAFIYYLDWING